MRGVASRSGARAPQYSAAVAGPRGLRLLALREVRYRPVTVHRPVVKWSLRDMLECWAPALLGYEAAPHTVFKMSLVTLYGSQLALGRLSSMYPLPSR